PAARTSRPRPKPPAASRGRTWPRRSPSTWRRTMSSSTSSAVAPAIEEERAVTLVDVDVHPTMMPASLETRLSPRAPQHYREFGPRVAGAYAMFPRMRNGGFRVDARPEQGRPGSDLGLVQRQHLDEHGIDHAVLTPMQAQSFGGEAPELAAELCRALNDW